MKRPANTVGRLDALTSMRFFAAAIVVLFHCGQGALSFMPVGIRGLMKDGYEAVSFFFILSGFVLAYSYYTPTSLVVRGGIAAFWKSRIARIYPIYFVATVIALPRYLYGIRSGTIQPKDAHIALIAVPLLVQSWFISDNISGAINLPAWSLSVEAFFYAAFPLLLRMTIAVGPILTTLLAYVGLICSESVLSHRLYFPLYHLFTFLMGIGCGVWFRQASPINMRTALYCVGVLLYGVFGFRDVLPHYVVSRVVIVPLFAALIVTIAGCAGTLKFLEHRLLVLLGDSSYSLYILHLPLYLWFVAAFKRLNITAGKSLSLTLFYLISMVAVSLVSHRSIEIPARSRLLKLTLKSRKETNYRQSISAERTT